MKIDSQLSNSNTYSNLGATTLPNDGTYQRLGARALYEIATMPPEERDKPQS